MTRLTTLLCLFIATGTSASAGGPDWIARTLAALDAHLERHPAAEAQDAYKLLHQAVMGPGHAVPDAAAARERLEREVAELAPRVHDEPLCEPIGGDPEMVRIHLRPFVARRFSTDALADAFVASAAAAPPRPQRLEEVLGAAVESLRDGGWSGRAEALDALREQMTADGFPAVRHSRTFRASYAPAYRIVTRGLAEAAGWCDDLATLDDTGPSDADAGADADAGPRAGS